VLDLACSPTDGLFVSASASNNSGRGELCAWDLFTGSKLGVYPSASASSSSSSSSASSASSASSSQDAIHSIVINHNGNMMVSGGGDGVIRVFDMSTRQVIMAWQAHQGQLSSVRFGSYETSVVSVGTSGQAVEWSLHRTDKVLRRCPLDISVPHSSSLVRPELSFDLNSHYFVVSDPAASSSSSSSASVSAFSSSSASVSASRYDALIYDITRSSLVQRIPGHSGAITSVDWHPHNLLITGSEDYTARISTLVPRA